MPSVKSIQCSRTASVAGSVKSSRTASVAGSVKSGVSNTSVTSTRSEHLISLAAKKAVLIAKKNGAKKINELQAKLQEVQLDNEIELVEAEEEVYAQFDVQDVTGSDYSNEEEVKKWISSQNDSLRQTSGNISKTEQNLNVSR